MLVGMSTTAILISVHFWRECVVHGCSHMRWCGIERTYLLHLMSIQLGLSINCVYWIYTSVCNYISSSLCVCSAILRQLMHFQVYIIM